ncbi:MAG: hypothetical protein LAT67_13115 [Balneolales bacterium]|nr:hypothetical protein [Balneolales bacterium]
MDREQLKEEYKQHYRQLNELKKKHAMYEKKARIIKNLDEMDPSPVMERFQSALHAVKERIAMAEARLEVYLDDQDESHLFSAQASGSETNSTSARSRNIAEDEEFLSKEKAKSIVNRIRSDMGIIQRELDEKAGKLPGDKTVF